VVGVLHVLLGWMDVLESKSLHFFPGLHSFILTLLLSLSFLSPPSLELLFDLHSCIDEPDSVLDSHFLVQNIESYLYQLELSGTELEYVLFFLCQSESPPNLLQFLIRTVRTKFKDFVKAKV
jgi:hypothetical protein